jgi:hypothetical protein
MRLKYDRRKLLVLAGLALATIAAAATVLVVLLGGDDEKSVRVVTGVQFPYPEGWTEQALSQDDRNAGLLLKLGQEDPAASFLARTVIARLSADFNALELAGETEAALAAQLEGFDLVSSDVELVGPYQAVLIEYQQPAVGEEPASQTLLVILPGENQTFYLTVRADKRDFRGIKDDGLKIVADFAAYVSASPN